MERRLELVSTVLLALAAVATAWAAYQSRQWTGEQSTGYSRATTARLSENRSAARANRQVQIDVATFIQWLDARAQNDDELANFYRRRFRQEFQPAFAAWLATQPFSDAKAPDTPFALPQYKLAAQAQADALEKTAAAASQSAKDANQHADNHACGRALLDLAVLRRHQHQAARHARTRRTARHRLRGLPRRADLDRHAARAAHDLVHPGGMRRHRRASRRVSS